MSREFKQPHVELYTGPFLSDAKVFEEALSIQEGFDQDGFDDFEDARQTVEWLTHRLNTQAYDIGLLNHTVHLSSSRIYEPSPYYNPVDGPDGVFEVKSEHDTNNIEHSIMGIEGPFFGFTNTLHAQDGDLSRIKGVLHYRVGVPRTINLPFLIGGKACAYAPISESDLTFQLDQRCHDANNALLTLTQPTDDGYEPSAALRILTQKLFNTLTFDTTNAKDIRTAGRVVRQHMNKYHQVTPPSVSDALLDLIGAQLGLNYGRQFTVSAGYGLISDQQNTAYVESPRYLSTLQGATYTSYLYRKNGLTYAEDYAHAPTINGSLVLPSQVKTKAVCRVPLERILRLSPVAT
ncbi:MAG: hypothetical protein WBP26_01445 [Candidatus Saccharimonadales bacterium]